jgi:tetratricopeptide (TPR) repeat protein
MNLHRLFHPAAMTLVAVIAACDPAQPELGQPRSTGPTVPAPASPAAPAAAPTPAPAAVSASPADAHIRLALKHWRQGEFVAAVAAMRKAVDSDQGNAGAHMSLGQSLLLRSAEKDAIAAEAEFRKALDLGYGKSQQGGNKVLPYLWLGRALIEQSRFDDAKVALESYLNQAPSKEDIAAGDALLRLGMVQLQAGDLDSARQSLRQAVTLSDAALSHPQANDAIYLQYVGEIQIESKLQFAMVLAQQGASDEAEKVFQSVITLQSDNDQVHYKLAKLYQKLGRTEDAAREQEIHDLLNQTRDNNSLRAKRDVDELNRIYTRLKEIFPTYWRSYTRLARAYNQNELPDQAIEQAEQLLKTAPETQETAQVRGEAYFVMGQAYTLKKDRGRALSSYEQAATLAPAFREKYEEIKAQMQQQKPPAKPN